MSEDDQDRVIGRIVRECNEARNRATTTKACVVQWVAEWREALGRLEEELDLMFPDEGRYQEQKHDHLANKSKMSFVERPCQSHEEITKALRSLRADLATREQRRKSLNDLLRD